MSDIQIPKNYTVDLAKTIGVTRLDTLFAVGDNSAHKFTFSLVCNGSAVDLSGCTVSAQFTNFSPHGITVNLDGAIESGNAAVTLNETCYKLSGRFALVVRIVKGTEKTSIFYGDGYMSTTSAETVVDGDYIIYDVDTLLAKIAEINAATAAANTAADNANSKASAANTAATKADTATTNANAATTNANAAAQKINGLTIAATGLGAGASPTAAVSEVSGHYHIALGIPKGETGATPQISVEVTTGAAGSEAQVSVTGTAAAPVIHLTIPRGDVGSIGSLTVNGLAPDGDGAVTLGVENITPDGRGPHNAVYRGANLGDAVTDEQYAEIADGNFRGMFIGDYWLIGGVKYRIAAFDYYLQTGDTETTAHHVTLVPDVPLSTHAMNDTNVTTGGYAGSTMYASGLDDAKTTISNAFGSAHILTHRQYLCNAVSDGKPSGVSWYDSTVELMTEQNVYGGMLFGAGNDGSTLSYLYTVDKSQYPLFAFRPDLISNRYAFWLRDVVSATSFARIGASGSSYRSGASDMLGVRPAFSIIG